MKIGDKVKTPLGPGIVINQEGLTGILSHRYLVKVNPLINSTYFRQLQDKQGGLYFLQKNLISSESKQIGLHF